MEVRVDKIHYCHYCETHGNYDVLKYIKCRLIDFRDGEAGSDVISAVLIEPAYCSD